MKVKLISIDLQKDFALKEGKHYKIRPSVEFVQNTLIPFLTAKNIKIAEIISDYRQPRPGDIDESCIPGTWGYESIVPQSVVASRWIKCMNSPLWTRDNIGNPDKTPGLPYQDTHAFGKWLEEGIGKPSEVTPVLFGLTIDCCVLSTLQELNWRGYYPLVLEEGVDSYSGDQSEKRGLFKSPISNWAKVITWDELQKML